MIKNKIVDLYNKTGAKDDFGGYIETPTFIKSIDCDIQPYSTELLLKNYGYNIEVSKRIFMDIDTDIKVGSILKYNNANLEVRKTIPWDNYMEVFVYGI